MRTIHAQIVASRTRKAIDALYRSRDNLSDIEDDTRRNWEYVVDQTRFAISQLKLAMKEAKEQAELQRNHNGDGEKLP
jgi:hypothetical protein